MNIDIKKLRSDAKLPVRANPSDAGADVFFCGDLPITLTTNESCILGTGLQIATPYGYVTEVKNRSGMAAKKSLVVGACVIDSGYEGELMVNLHNIGTKPQVIKNGDKIAQIIVYQVELPEFSEVPEGVPLYTRTPTISSRKDGGFGSTDK
jgi:dUTP pyrophosphatase